MMGKAMGQRRKRLAITRGTSSVGPCPRHGVPCGHHATGQVILQGTSHDGSQGTLWEQIMRRIMGGLWGTP